MASAWPHLLSLDAFFILKCYRNFLKKTNILDSNYCFFPKISVFCAFFQKNYESVSKWRMRPMRVGVAKPTPFLWQATIRIRLYETFWIFTHTQVYFFSRFLRPINTKTLVLGKNQWFLAKMIKDLVKNVRKSILGCVWKSKTFQKV